MPSSAPSIREVSLSHWKRSSFAVFLRAEVLKRLLSLPRRARRRLLSLSPAPRSSSQAPLSPYDERWAMTLSDFCCLYGLVGYHARLERLGFLSVASLRTACNMYLLKPQGYGSPGRRNDNKPIPRGFSQSEIDRLFAAVTLWEDGRDRDGERIGRIGDYLDRVTDQRCIR